MSTFKNSIFTMKQIRKAVLLVASLAFLFGAISGILTCKELESRYGQAIDLEEYSSSVVVKNIELWKGTIYINDLKFAFSKIVCNSSDDHLSIDRIKEGDILFYNIEKEQLHELLFL